MFSTAEVTYIIYVIIIATFAGTVIVISFTISYTFIYGSNSTAFYIITHWKNL